MNLTKSMTVTMSKLLAKIQKQKGRGSDDLAAILQGILEQQVATNKVSAEICTHFMMMS